jgi:hypothetical protein
MHVVVVSHDIWATLRVTLTTFPVASTTTTHVFLTSSYLTHVISVEYMYLWIPHRHYTVMRMKTIIAR